MPGRVRVNHQSWNRQLLRNAKQLSQDVAKLRFDTSIPWVYNPLEYAWKPHRQFWQRYALPSCRVLFLGMNPGPWGMAQTGIPFGEVTAVREFLKIDAPISRPLREHPKRPIQGWDCPRSEVSGRRLWGLFQQQFTTPEAFFEQHFVVNYCPLVFMESSARNVTPDKLPADSRRPLEDVCDQHLARLLEILQPEWLIGVGGFAEKCGSRILESWDFSQIQLGRILHPSPASPAANRDWAGTASRQLRELGIW
ncbi:MAG: single-stranded DNA-binding protein [bacterium]|nr:single-stranded DNA-binding protein [bacterium]